MRKYRHRQSGAVFETDRDMPPLDWERIDQEQKQGQEQAPEPKRRSRARRKDTSKE